MTRLSRWSGSLLLAGGVAFVALNAAAEVAFPEHWAGSGRTFLGLSYAGFSRLLWVPEALLLFGLVGAYPRLSTVIGRLGRAGLWLVGAGLALGGLGTIIEFWVCGVLLVPFLGDFRTGSACSNLGYGIASIGALGLLLPGLLLLAAAGWRARLSPRGQLALVLPGLTFGAGIVLAIVALTTGQTWLTILYAIITGAGWLPLGMLLHSSDTFSVDPTTVPG